MKAQIEAAKALVKRFEYESMALHHNQRDWLIKEIAALTAAAEVGEPKTEDEFTRIMDARVDATNATIERCAQVAFHHAHNGGHIGRAIQTEIAAAIRALKEDK